MFLQPLKDDLFSAQLLFNALNIRFDDLSKLLLEKCLKTQDFIMWSIFFFLLFFRFHLLKHKLRQLLLFHEYLLINNF